MTTVKVRFLADYTVKAAGGASYRAGSVCDLPADTARHFIRRRRAVAVDADVQRRLDPRPQPKRRHLASVVEVL